jgi:hypothetical protein
MPRFFTAEQLTTVVAICSRLIPTDEDPGATEAQVATYIDGLLGAFATDPPLIWAGGGFSGRFGGTPGFAAFQRLTPLEELSWRTRIEGSLGIAERERLGPVVGLQERYLSALDALGSDFDRVNSDEQDRRLRALPEVVKMIYGHACEGMYAAPEYGGNHQITGWGYIDYRGDVQPIGYTDEDVSQA